MTDQEIKEVDPTLTDVTGYFVARLFCHGDNMFYDILPLEKILRSNILGYFVAFTV